MFAVFDHDCARPPPCLDNSTAAAVDPEEGYERALHHMNALKRLKYGEGHPELTSKNGGDFQEFYCGTLEADDTTRTFRGGGAVAFCQSEAQVTLAWAVQQWGPESSQLPCVVVCAGDVTNSQELRTLYGLPTEGEPSAAQMILDLYCRDFGDKDGDTSDQPATCLNNMEGDWSFVLFDAGDQYLLAGQSGTASHPMHWGTAKEDGALMFSTQADLVSELCSGPTHFPPGCFFQNDGFLNPTYDSGQISSFNHPMHARAVKPIPRVDSKNHVFGISFRTVSNTDLCAMEAPTPMAAENEKDAFYSRNHIRFRSNTDLSSMLAGDYEGGDFPAWKMRKTKLSQSSLSGEGLDN